MIETAILSDGLHILVGFWNLYFTRKDPNIILQGLPVIEKLMGFDKDYYTSEEANFIQKYVEECNYIIQPESYLDYEFNNNQMWEDREDDPYAY
jgi:hypothetical protein|tara:strand:- start:302 stop:583 length:282 start_codon:yes stop_codon:yes gene_type:complete